MECTLVELKNLGGGCGTHSGAHGAACENLPLGGGFYQALRLPPTVTGPPPSLRDYGFHGRPQDPGRMQLMQVSTSALLV